MKIREEKERAVSEKWEGGRGVMFSDLLWGKEKMRKIKWERNVSVINQLVNYQNTPPEGKIGKSIDIYFYISI